MDNKTPAEIAFEESGETYRSVGERIGVSPAAVCEIIKGRTRGATARFSVAAALGKPVSDLWPEDAAPRAA